MWWTNLNLPTDPWVHVRYRSQSIEKRCEYINSLQAGPRDDTLGLEASGSIQRGA